MLRRLARLVAAAGIVCAMPAHALGLGEVDVRSKLNQKFSASIPVIEASAQDLESLQVTMASAADFERAGVERADYVSSLTIKLETGAGGPRVSVTSEKIDHEPFLNFLVDAHWQGGHLLREYTVLLDPPTLASSQGPIAAPAVPATDIAAEPPPAAPAADAATSSSPASPAAAPEAAAVPASAAPSATASPANVPAESTQAPPPAAPIAPRHKTPPPAAAKPVAAPAPIAETANRVSDKTYGPIDPAETLWSIAGKLRPESASTDQILLALGLANPEAFTHGRFNGLLSGSTLNVPSDDQILSVPVNVAKARVAKWRDGGSLTEGGADVAPAATSAPIEKAKPAAAEKKADAPSKPVAPTTTEVAPTAPLTAPGSVKSPVAASSPADNHATKPPKGAAASASSSVLPTAPIPDSAPAATNSSAVPATPAKQDSAAVTAPSSAASAAPSASINSPTTAAPIQGTASPNADSTAASAAPPKVGTESEPAAPSVATAPPITQAAPATPPPTTAASSGLGDLSLPLIVILMILLIGYFGWRATRPKDASSKPGAARVSKGPVMSKSSAPSVPSSAAAKSGPTASAQDLDSILGLGAAASPAKRPVEMLPEEESPTVFAPVAAPRPSEDLTKIKPASPGAGDPLTEADFHLAYGLHDEAANLLRRGIEKEPIRKDLRIKLAETYFAAHKAPEFQQTALALRGQIPETEWQKLAAMGRQIAPDIAAFKDSADPHPVAAPPPTERPAPHIGSSAPERGLDFDFAPPATMSPAMPTAAAENKTNLIDFDFDSALSDLQPKSARTGLAPPAMPAHETTHFDAGHSEPAPASVTDLHGDELDLSQAFPEGAAVGSEDEISTKLDLARAYADMGDNHAATDLLREVALAGSAAQKQEAEALTKRLGAV